MNAPIEPISPSEYVTGLTRRSMIGGLLICAAVLLMVFGHQLPEAELLGMDWTLWLVLLAAAAAFVWLVVYVYTSQKRLAAWKAEHGERRRTEDGDQPE